MNHMTFRSRTTFPTAFVAAALLSLGLTACSGDEDTAPSGSDHVPVSSAPASGEDESRMSSSAASPTSGSSSNLTGTELTAPGTHLPVGESATVILQPWGMGDATAAAPVHYWKITPHPFREADTGDIPTLPGVDTDDIDHWICMTFDAELLGVLDGEDPGAGIDSYVPALTPVAADGGQGNLLLYPNGSECGTPRDAMFPDRVSDLEVGTVYQGVAAGYISRSKTPEMNPDGVEFEYSIRDDRFPELEDAEPIIWS